MLVDLEWALAKAEEFGVLDEFRFALRTMEVLSRGRG